MARTSIHLKVQHPGHPDTGSFLATRTKAKPTQCQFCHKEFVKPILLVRHVKWKHAKEVAKAEAKKKVASGIKVSKTQSKKFSCDLCDKSFKTTKDLYSHTVKVHHLDRSVQLESEEDEDLVDGLQGDAGVDEGQFAMIGPLDEMDDLAIDRDES